jgi:hypothetical protein
MGSLFTPDDRRCCCLFEVETAGAAPLVNDAAGLPYTRIALQRSTGQRRAERGRPHQSDRLPSPHRVATASSIPFCNDGLHLLEDDRRDAENDRVQPQHNRPNH